MTTPEEIEQLKLKLEQTTGERKQAEVLLDLLKKYASINSTESQPFIDRLLQLAEKLNEPLYKARALYYLANLKRIKGEYDVSIDLSQQTIPLFEQIKERKGMASSYNILGIVYDRQGNYPEALKNHFAALKLQEEIGNKSGIANSYNNLGIVYEKQGNYPEALKNHFAALKIREELGHKSGISGSYNSIGNVYQEQGNYPEALKNHFTALKLSEEIGDKSGIASSCNGIGLVYENQGNYPEALKNHFTVLKLSEEIGDKSDIASTFLNIGSIYDKQGNYSEALKNHFTALKLSEEIGNKYIIVASYNGIGAVYEKQGNYPEALKNQLLTLNKGEEIGSKSAVKESSLSLSNVYKATHDFENALKYYEKYHEVEKEILGAESQKQLTNLNFMHNMEQKEKDLEIEQLRNVELKKERDRSESLLLNILPAEVAEELKNKGTADAKHFDNVTVLFTDFKGFTTVSEKLTPQQLVDELHACFSGFDAIISKYNIEKIKTVGDAYLAVSGLPLANPNHAEDMVKAAIEIRDFIGDRKKEKQSQVLPVGEDLGGAAFEVRIGIHSGSVVAGIVGVKKFAYDIWGDTVNTAARMEQNSEAGKINISETTYGLVKEKFKYEYRGEIEAKNKGKLKMYFVN